MEKWGTSVLKEEVKMTKVKTYISSGLIFLTGEETIFSLTVFSNGTEKCARLWADDNFWPSSCQWGKAKWGQKAFSQLQTSAWCRRHQSGATTLPLKEPGGNARGMMVYLSVFLCRLSCFPFAILTSSYSLSQLSVGVCGGIALLSHTRTHTLTGKQRREGKGGDWEMWFGDSRVISLCIELRRRIHRVKQRQSAHGNTAWKAGQKKQELETEWPLNWGRTSKVLWESPKAFDGKWRLEAVSPVWTTFNRKENDNRKKTIWVWFGPALHTGNISHGN